MVKNIALFVAFLTITLSSVSTYAGYRSDLNSATARGRIYSFHNFDAKLIWNATFFSDKFRRSFEKRHIKINHIDDPIQSSRFIAEQELRQSNGWDFFIGLYAMSDYGKLSNEPDGFWKIYMTTGSGERVMPTAIELIPISPYENEMYFYLNRWSKGYRITFPKVELGNQFSLTLHSVVGESVLKWNNK